MKKKLTAVLTAALLLLSLTACSNDKTAQSTNNTNTTKFTPKLDTDTTDTLEIAGFMGNFEALDEVINGFNDIYPNVTITYDHNTLFMLPQYLKSNTNIDLFMTSDQNIKLSNSPDYFVADSCLDLSKEDLDVSSLQENAIKDCSVDGKLVTLPVAMNTYGIVVNKTLLKKEGLSVPTNYQEFLNVLETLKTKGYTPLQGSQKHLYGDLMINMAMNLIAENPDLEKALEAKDSSAADAIQPVFDRLEAIINKGYTDYKLNCTYPEDNYDGSIMAFFEGKMPFYVCNAECVSGMKKRESKSEAFTADPFDYEFMYAPTGANGVYAYTEPWYGFAVNKDSDQKDLAVEFLRFMATKLDDMASIKGLPSVMADSTADSRYTAIQNVKNTEASFSNDGSVPDSMRLVFLDVCQKLGSGEYKNAKEAAIAFTKQELPKEE